MIYKIVVYKDLRSAWRWRLIAPNGQVMADSAEAYYSKSNAKRSAKRLVELGLDALVIEK